jgi:transcriptional regulator with XRE-family HTH domain
MTRKKTDFKKNFSARLRLSLDGRSQTEVAKRIGYSRAVMSMYLLGDIPNSFTLLMRLAKEFNIDLHKLLTGDDAPSLVEAVKCLNPFVLGYFADMVARIQRFKGEIIDVLADANRSEADSVKIQWITREIKHLETYYSIARDQVNKVLEPLGQAVPPIL